MGQDYVTKRSARGDDDSTYEDYDDYGDDSDVFYGEAYRTEDDYLEAPEAPYVNYIDEAAMSDDNNAGHHNTISATPSSTAMAITIDRNTAFSSDYYETTATLLAYADDMDTCVNQLSYALDQSVEKDPSIQANSAEIQTLMTTYAGCKASVDKDYANKIKQTVGYQQAYFSRAKQCVSRYDS